MYFFNISKRKAKKQQWKFSGKTVGKCHCSKIKSLQLQGIIQKLFEIVSLVFKTFMI